MVILQSVGSGTGCWSTASSSELQITIFPVVRVGESPLHGATADVAPPAVCPHSGIRQHPRRLPAGARRPGLTSRQAPAGVVPAAAPSSGQQREGPETGAEAQPSRGSSSPLDLRAKPELPSNWPPVAGRSLSAAGSPFPRTGIRFRTIAGAPMRWPGRGVRRTLSDSPEGDRRSRQGVSLVSGAAGVPVSVGGKVGRAHRHASGNGSDFRIGSCFSRPLSREFQAVGREKQVAFLLDGRAMSL